MNETVTLDEAGRVELPKALRDELHLSAGDTLELIVEGDDVKLRPRRTSSSLQKERGVWVFRTGEPHSSDDAGRTLQRIREQRAKRTSGNTA